MADPAPRPDPAFTVLGAEPVPRSSAPTLRFRLGVEDDSGVPVQFIVLSVLVTIEPGRRDYAPADRERLVELFGEPERWGSTTGSFRWTQVSTVVGPFERSGLIDVDVECTYDHEVAVTKYFGGIGNGAYPLQMHFNGTVYYLGEQGSLQVMPLAWDRSARFDLPVATWRRMIDGHYPGGAWLRVEEETLHELSRLKAATGAPTTDAAIRALIAQSRTGTQGAGP